MRFLPKLSCFLATLAILTPALLAAPPPVILAADTSRSLAQAELGAATGVLAEIAASLPAGTPVGLLEFGDAPRWLVALTGERPEVLARLRDLAPGGQHTLLHDALVLAAQALPGGGVIAAATDGRDENSATTADDVARVCAANHVRLVFLATGRRVDERGLRRLALLTSGAYLAPGGGGEAGRLLAAVAAAQQGIANEAPRIEPVSAPTPQPQPTVVPAPAPAPVLGRPLWQWALLALAALAVPAGVLLWRRQRAEERRVCERCGSALEPWETECVPCRLREAAAAERAASEAPAAAVAAVPLDARAFERQALAEAIDKTFVLGEQFVLLVKEHRKPPRTVYLQPDKPFSVGRAPKVNTLTLADPTLSAQHFRIVFQEGAYYIADLGATNGTFVNGEKVRA
ncbi:MAG: FHA domain-containing protein [Acidobacteriota bacterium]